MKWAKRLLGVAGLVVVSGSVRPVLAQATGRVAAVVTDSMSAQPLAGATVVIVGTRLGGQTGTDGRITLNNVPTGAHQVRIQRIGYAPRTLTITP